MKVFLTGASGTLGTQLLERLRLHKKSILGLTRNEHHISKLAKKCTPVLGDIRDREKMINVTKGVDVILHLAALKHVDLMETHIDECIQTNLEGTRNLVDAQKINNIPKIIFISTDKAVFPINAYGMCKAVSEKLVLQNSNNAVCRYGNVFESRGSVFERLPDILSKTNTLMITEPRMTRFWIKKKDAADFVHDVFVNMFTGVRIPKMKACKVLDLMKIFATKYGYNGYDIREIGMRPGEKLHESLTPVLHSHTCEQYTKEELERIVDESVAAWK